jgi:hypothetical protein
MVMLRPKSVDLQGKKGMEFKLQLVVVLQQIDREIQQAEA